MPSEEIAPRVLLVEDQAGIRHATALALQRAGFYCEQAEDGSHALALLAEEHFDAVVTDMRMPRMHGHDLVLALIDRKPPPAVIVVYTSLRDDRLAKDLRARGVDDILYKPCDSATVARRVKALVDVRLGKLRLPTAYTLTNVRPFG